MGQFAEEGKVDVMGRIAGWRGFDTPVDIPVGSRVRIHEGSYCSGCASRHYVGEEAVVVTKPWTSDRTTGPEVGVRFSIIQNEWDRLDNGRRFRPSVMEVLSVGDGTVTPGVSYPLSKIELLDERFKALDKRHQEYTNYPTFLAHLYLSQEQSHVRAIQRMVKKDNTVSRPKLASYFAKLHDLQPQREDYYPDGFPEHLEFRLPIDWDDVATEFQKQFAEMHV